MTALKNNKKGVLVIPSQGSNNSISAQASATENMTIPKRSNAEIGILGMKMTCDN